VPVSGPAVRSSPFLHAGSSVAGMMREVLVALVPGALAATWWFGWGVPAQIAVAAVTAAAGEALLLRVRARPVRRGVADGSALLTGVLVALALPPYVPWWLTTFAVFTALALGKHVYGGLGANPFNPAMVGYALAMVCFPAWMSHWPGAAAPGAPAAVLGLGAGVDAVSGATPLGEVRTGLRLMWTLAELNAEGRLYGLVGPPGWEWINAGYLAGGAWLLYRRVIGWHIPAGVLGAMFAWALLMHLVDGDRHPGPAFHLLGGGIMLAAFFVATDPVTAPTTRAGQMLFALALGSLVFAARTWGAHPDGIAFAVLAANAAAPVLERWTRPPVLGRPR